MNPLERIWRKKKRTVIGLMSGTSADGIDATLAEISGAGTSTAVRILAFETFPYPRGFKRFLLKNSNPETARIDNIARLEVLVGEFFADAAVRIARRGRKPREQIDFIGSHGQTLHHLPIAKRLFGRSIRSTFQVGDPSVIAKRTGIVTVGNFRMGDMALGGSGAPLVPLFDYLILRSRTRNRIVLNIGGIANLTILPKGCRREDVTAFDTGPGNMVVDALAQYFFSEPYDRGGALASKGIIHTRLLRKLLDHPYLRRRPPKSTGREMFGEGFVKSLLKYRGEIYSYDFITTATEFTALSIYEGYRRFLKPAIHADELIVSGGGSKNIYLMEALRRYFGGIRVMTSDEFDIPSDAKEAICFAVLANETLAGNPGNIPGATGADRPTILGSICLP